MWRIILWLSVVLHSTRASLLPTEPLEDSTETRSICLKIIDDIFSTPEEKAVEVDYVDEALKIISNEVGFQFSEDDPPSWYIDPSTVLPVSLKPESSEKKRVKRKSPSPKPSSKLKGSVHTKTVPTSSSSSASTASSSSTSTATFAFTSSTLPTPEMLQKPNMQKLDPIVDVPLIQAWLLYKYRLASLEFSATRVNYERVTIHGWPMEVPFVKERWTPEHVLYLKEAIVDEIRFEVGGSTVNWENNFTLEMRLKEVMGCPIEEPLDWSRVTMFMHWPLTCSNWKHWNFQDRKHLRLIIAKAKSFFKPKGESKKRKRSPKEEDNDGEAIV